MVYNENRVRMKNYYHTLSYRQPKPLEVMTFGKG